jgi:hypothetical protein
MERLLYNGVERRIVPAPSGDLLEHACKGIISSKEPGMSNQEKKPESDKPQPMGVWIAIGIAIGAGIGAALDNLAIGVAIGLAIGAAIGAAQSNKI